MSIVSPLQTRFNDDPIFLFESLYYRRLAIIIVILTLLIAPLKRSNELHLEGLKVKYHRLNFHCFINSTSHETLCFLLQIVSSQKAKHPTKTDRQNCWIGIKLHSENRKFKSNRILGKVTKLIQMKKRQNMFGYKRENEQFT